MSGFLQLHRRVYENPVFADMVEASVFVWMTAQAAWKPTKVRYKNRIISLERGQLAISIRDLANKWGWSKAKAERYINRATRDHMIETLSETGVTIITICNYNKYQSLRDSAETPSETEARHQPGQKRDSSETQNNKGNKYNKINNPPISPQGGELEYISLSEELRELVGLPQRVSFVPVKNWLEAGISADLIRRVVEDRAAQARVSAKQIKSFSYFENPIMEAQRRAIGGGEGQSCAERYADL